VLSKFYVYTHGGRPVVYDNPADAKRYITDTNEHWRIVSLKLTETSDMTDWMHEREWRVPGDLVFDYPNVAVLIDTKASYREFINKCKGITTADILGNICGIVVLSGLLELA
jgi:hypothetical protein